MESHMVQCQAMSTQASTKRPKMEIKDIEVTACWFFNLPSASFKSGISDSN